MYRSNFHHTVPPPTRARKIKVPPIFRCSSLIRLAYRIAASDEMSHGHTKGPLHLINGNFKRRRDATCVAGVAVCHSSSSNNSRKVTGPNISLTHFHFDNFSSTIGGVKDGGLDPTE